MQNGHTIRGSLPFWPNMADCICDAIMCKIRSSFSYKSGNNGTILESARLKTSAVTAFLGVGLVK